LILDNFDFRVSRRFASVAFALAFTSDALGACFAMMISYFCGTTVIWVGVWAVSPVAPIALP
jgi:hypothetical protein